MIVDTLKERAKEAMKAKDSAATQIYRLALGEIQTLEARAARAVTEEEAEGVVRKLVKSNEETLSLSTDDAQKGELEKEIALLTAVLPKGLSVEEIVALLAPVADAIKAAGNDGQATGVAMKHLKASGTSAQGKDVGAAVKTLRS